MKNPTKKALVLCGEGMNCERETAFALQTVGFEVEIAMIQELANRNCNQEAIEREYSLIAFPGGFSFGDELGSGRVLAIKIRKQLKWDLIKFALQGGMVIGICNGFQALIRLGVFGRSLTITRNSTGQFIDRWVHLQIDTSHSSPWLKDMNEFELPIRHGEGRIIFENPSIPISKNECESAIRYRDDVNGSHDQLAALTAAKGRILGLMPHPEAFVRSTQHPTWTQTPHSPAGLKIFENAKKELL